MSKMSCFSLLEIQNRKPLKKKKKFHCLSDTQFPSVKTVAMLLAEKKQRMKEGFDIAKLLNPKHPPQTKLPLSPRPHQNKKSDIGPTLMVPQAFVITQPKIHQGVYPPQSVGQGIQSGVHGTAGCHSQPVLELVLSMEPEISAQPTPSPFNPTSTVASTENAQVAPKCKPTAKTSVMKVRTDRSRKKSTRNNQGICDSPAVAVLPQTTTWILTPAGLMPLTEIQLPSPGITGVQNQVIPKTVPEQVLHQPLTVNQHGLVHAVGPSNSTNVTPADAASSSVGTNTDQRPSVSSLPSMNDTPVFSSAVTSMTGVPTTNVPNSVNQSIIASSSATATPAQEGTISAAIFENQNVETSHVSQVFFQQPIVVNQNGSLALISAARPHLPSSVSPKSIANEVLPSPASSSSTTVSNVPVVQTVTPPPVVLLSPTSQRLPMLQEIVQDEIQSLQTATVNASPNPDTSSFDSNLMLAEDPAAVKRWMKGSEGISLPEQDKKMPYLPPFVGNINTLLSLLKAKESLLQRAAWLLPEEEAGIEEGTKVAALRKLVSERFKTNPAHSLLKARFLSCFTLPALLATIHPCKEWKLYELGSDEDEEASPYEVELRESGTEDMVQPNVRMCIAIKLLQELLFVVRINCGGLMEFPCFLLQGTLCNTNESEASARQFSGMSRRKRSRSLTSA